jgi:hypothetical protein
MDENAYETALAAVVDATQTLQAAVNELDKARGATGRAAPAGWGVALQLWNAAERAMAAWRHTCPALMGIEVPDPTARAIADAERNLAFQHSCWHGRNRCPTTIMGAAMGLRCTGRASRPQKTH